MKLKLFIIAFLIILIDVIAFVACTDEYISVNERPYYLYQPTFIITTILNILLFCYLLFTNYKFGISFAIFLFIINKYTDINYYYYWIDFKFHKETIKNAVLITNEGKYIEPQPNYLSLRNITASDLLKAPDFIRYKKEGYPPIMKRWRDDGNWFFITIPRFSADPITYCRRAYYIYCKDINKEQLEKDLRSWSSTQDDFHSFTQLDTNFYLFRNTTGFNFVY